MSAPEYFRQLAGARRVALALTLAQQREFVELLRDYAAEVERRVATGAARGLSRRTLADLERIIGELVRDMARSTGANIRLTADRVARIQAEATLGLLSRSSRGRRVPVAFDAVAARATQAILARPELAQAFRTIQTEAVGDVNRILRRGVLRGAPAGAIARELRQYILAPGSIAEGDAALLKDRRRIAYREVEAMGYERTAENLGRIRGEASTIAWKARRIARTEIMQTERETFIQAAIDSPVVAYVQISLSYRHKQKCACEPIALADLFGFGPGRYDPRMVPPRPHPNCWCPHTTVLRPEEDWGKERGQLPELMTDPEEIAQRFGLSPSASRSYADAVRAARAGATELDPADSDPPQRRRRRGAAAAAPTPPAPPEPGPPLPSPPGGGDPLAERLRGAEQWLMDQPLEHAFGYAADGTEVIRKTSGHRSAVFFTEDEVARMRDLIFTHNHPTAGVSFSDADISLAIRYDLQEMRAVDGARKQHIYRWIRPDGGWPADREGLITRVLLELESAERDVGTELQPRVLRGELTPDDAWYEHLHRAWERVAGRLGLLYQRVRWEE